MDTTVSNNFIMSDLQFWLAFVLEILVVFGGLIVFFVKNGNRITKMESNIDNQDKKIKDIKDELMKDISEIKKDLQVHEMNNEKTYSRIENEVTETKREVKEANSKLDLLLGYFKAKMGQDI